MQGNNMPQFGVKSPSTQSQPEPIFAMEATPTTPEPTQKLKPNKKPHFSFKNPLQVLAILCAALGIIAVIFLTTTIWLLVNGKTRTVVEKPKSSSVTASSTISADVFGFSPDKIVNSGDTTYRLGVHRTNSAGDEVFSAYISSDNTKLDITVSWSLVEETYGLYTPRSDVESFTLSMSQQIVDLVLFHQTSDGDDLLLMLLADGSVERMPVKISLTNRSFQSFGSLKDLDSVVKFYTAEAAASDGATATTILAQRSDGSIVDIRNFL